MTRMTQKRRKKRKNKKKSEQNKSDSTPDESTPSQSQEEPKVSKERFYEVKKTDLKDLFTNKGGFSVTKLFSKKNQDGNDDEEEDLNAAAIDDDIHGQEESVEDKGALSSPKKKKKKSKNIKSEEDSKIDNLAQDDAEKADPQSPPQPSGFFVLSLNDPRLQTNEKFVTHANDKPRKPEPWPTDVKERLMNYLGRTSRHNKRIQEVKAYGQAKIKMANKLGKKFDKNKKTHFLALQKKKEIREKINKRKRRTRQRFQGLQ